MHEGGMLMKSRPRQAFGQGVCDIKGTPTFVQFVKFNIDVTAAIAIDGILTHEDACSVVFPHACGAKRGAVKA